MSKGNYIPLGPEWEKEISKFPKRELISMLRDALIKQTRLNTESWEPEVKEDGCIHIPDELDPLFNRIGTQMRFHTISGEGETITCARILKNAQDFFVSAREVSRVSGKQFDLSMIDQKECIGKKITDIYLSEDKEYDELQILLEGGKQIEIILHQEGYIHVQTD